MYINSPTGGGEHDMNHPRMIGNKADFTINSIQSILYLSTI
jgi:hypothetical protein